MQPTFKSFGVKEQSRVDSEVERCAEAIRIAGYTVLSDVISEPAAETMRKRLDELYELQLSELGGKDVLASIGDTYTAMALLAYDEAFLAVAMEPRVLAVVGHLLGDYFTVMLQNGIINVPHVGHEQTPGSWHRDLGYQHFVSSRPLAVTALLCLDEFSELTGGTRLLPASHKTEAFPSEAFVTAHEVGIVAAAGSVILFDAMLYHRAGHNTSPRVRRAVNTTYALPLIKQQISLPRMLGGRFGEDPAARRLLGYESEPAASVLEFRRTRVDRLRKS